MKQIIQDLKSGNTTLEEVPVPQIKPGAVLIRTTRSLVSKGTEKMLVEFGKSSLLNKALQQPERVKQVIDKIKTDGLVPTMEAVFLKLEQPLPLGYCNVGKVVGIGNGVTDFSVGDRVVSNGNHAEYVNVYKNLVVKIPDNVSDDEAVFTVIGSIGLQGIRLCNPTLGEIIVVTGLGLIGLLTSQMLIANGCRVIGIDIDSDKCSLAEKWGVMTINPSNGIDPVKRVLDITEGVGVDGVVITASSKTNDIVSQSALMCRKRGRIILIGVVGLNLNRAEFYEKELTFQVSCSYGPGRYDDNYEQKGIDYPLTFVRWTERRNFETILHTISSGQLKVKELISDIVDLEEYQKIYDNISNSHTIASVIRYPSEQTDENSGNYSDNNLVLNNRSFIGEKCVIGIIGAGNFTKMTLLPSLKGSGANLKYIASSNGITGTALAKKFGFANSTTDYRIILNDQDVDTVIVTTRHDSHARFVTEALKAGKNVFVEKPLAINIDQLNSIIQVYNNAYQLNSQNRYPVLTVGFNRRFSPHIKAVKKALGEKPGPINIVATMNAGFIPQNLWVNDLYVGGGRIVGEACHYIDLCVYLTGSEIHSVCMNALGESPNENTDNASILLKFKNGSNAVVNYFSNGAKSYSKERVEVYFCERILIIDNFRTTKAFGFKGFRNLKTRIDKGHRNQFEFLVKQIKSGGIPLIPFNEIVNVSKATFAALDSLKEKKWINL